MGRIYKKLECGCLISCDGGGGLIPCTFDDSNPNCKAREYMKKHKIKHGYCPICHPIEYNKFVRK